MDENFLKYLNEEFMIDEDFLCRLDPNSIGDFPGGCDNDNGILFSAFVIILLYLIDRLPDYKERADKGIGNLQVPGYPGIYNRSNLERHKDYYEQHDNYIGIIAISLLYDLKYANDIYEEGRYKFKFNRYLGFDQYFNYNNQNPRQFILKCQRQGGEIAIYQMAAGRLPNPIYLLWLAGGLWTSAWITFPSTMNLGWIRIQTMKIAISKKWYLGYLKPYIWAVEKVNSLILKYKGVDTRWGFDNYYKKYHPVHPLLDILFKKQ
jgi:hypothetical protein